jgi:uncharacterized membrane protein YkvA (DUF1232 family)
MAKPQDPSPAASALFKKYLTDPPISAEEIRERLKTYLDFVARVAQVNPTVDESLGGRISETLEQLLKLTPPEKFKYVQAAARYFIEDEDAEADLVSAGGFDDDILVVNAVCHHLGHDELQLT